MILFEGKKVVSIQFQEQGNQCRFVSTFFAKACTYKIEYL